MPHRAQSLGFAGCTAVGNAAAKKQGKGLYEGEGSVTAWDAAAVNACNAGFYSASNSDTTDLPQ